MCPMKHPLLLIAAIGTVLVSCSHRGVQDVTVSHAADSLAVTDPFEVDLRTATEYGRSLDRPLRERQTRRHRPTNA